MVSTWKRPGQGPLTFQRIAIVAPVTHEGVRRQIEDQLARELGPGRATASYTLLPGPIDKAALKARLAEGGYDGAIAVRIPDVEKEADFVGDPIYYGFGGWPMYDPGYVTVDTYVRVETRIYEMPSGELLFAATSKTVNPRDVTALVDETLNAVREELKKEGLIAPPVAAR